MTLSPSQLREAARIQCEYCARDWPRTHRDGTTWVHRPPGQPNGYVHWCLSSRIWDAGEGAVAVAEQPVPIAEKIKGILHEHLRQRYCYHPAESGYDGDFDKSIITPESVDKCAEQIAALIQSPATPPLDFSRPLVWCVHGLAARYIGRAADDGWHVIGWDVDGSGDVVNSTGHDRSGRQVVKNATQQEQPK